MDARLDLLRDWLGSLPGSHGLDPATLRPASDDASFRRYFRVDARGAPGGTRIAMDAPPPMEDVRPFVHAAAVFAGSGVSVPAVLEADPARGLLLLEDFGSTTYLARLDAQRAPALYADALRALVTFQAGSDASRLPPYDRARLHAELMLFPQWYVERHKGVTLTDAERTALEAMFGLILASNLAQPTVTVHRDYHSRNLMVLEGERNPGILDFQDAVRGPITYDLASLLRDAYIRWDEEQVIDWAVRYWERARRAGLPVNADFGEFYRDFEWMGLQRHLKVLGIFARLYHRDGKDRYLADLPLVLRYVRDALARYGALAPLARLLDRVEGRSGGAGLTF
jgi:aminoglycoside/choline kinase family phosphotransferase